ncbi:MAG: hypothetical protein PHD37_17465 [Gallionellaceae bacterium]|nr:hypothetical protein [Gallionellaceae bacterium]
MEIISTTWAVGLTVALVGVLGAFQVHRYMGRCHAASIFRAAIDPTVFSGLNGHALHGALIKVFPYHLAAAKEFRRYLGPIDRWRFRKAWIAYHGGSEDQPDWFVLYCVPENGNQLLVNHLESLVNATNQT